MNESPVEGRGWSTRTWWITASCIAAAQVFLIFWLSDYRLTRPRDASPSPTLTLDHEGSPELLSLLDPTHFALPKKQGFAGLAWLKSPGPQFQGFDWSEPPRWLTVSTSRLAAANPLQAPTGGLPSSIVLSMPDPPSVFVDRSTAFDLRSRSTLVVAGVGGPAPELLDTPNLPSWPPRAIGATDTDLLTNSVVQVVLNARGQPISPPTLLSRSGSNAADEWAVAQSRNLRFEPAAIAEKQRTEAFANLRWCHLVFQWHTLPATNAPGSPPP